MVHFEPAPRAQVRLEGRWRSTNPCPRRPAWAVAVRPGGVFGGKLTFPCQKGV
ncbi:hypothetical protein CLV63_12847 [Murinocardiopsis flavida]|uniref:Uncharacterized protein n=1 Tax=Murinocardiopsis flavida TaxID=645275 RepID=A0A2P8CVJ0_9ACTN|nr:hypothetical protein CLV63_12847 [Murinocardiopsis flavida]